MSEIIRLDERRRKEKREDPPATIKRTVDGEIVEYVICDEGAVVVSTK
jgi:hypothetical protein